MAWMCPSIKARALVGLVEPCPQVTFFTPVLMGTKKGTRGSLFSNRNALSEAFDAFVAALGADRELFAAFAAA